MNLLERLRLYITITRSEAIARRYFVVNGFDGALTMLGLTVGFLASGADVAPGVVLGACLGAAIALGMSGLTSAYISESAEKKKELRELESAMMTDLHASTHGMASRLIPVLVALVNGLAPLLISLVIILPLWLGKLGVGLPVRPLPASIGMAIVMLFLLGVFLGRISGSFWLWAGLRTLVIGVVTVGLVLWLAG